MINPRRVHSLSPVGAFSKRAVLIGALLVSALLVRWISAWFSVGFEHPNEIYRLLEPLAFLRGYSAVLPWEWQDQLLSWIPIGFHHFLLFPVKDLDALTQVRLLHFIYGALGVLPVYCSYILVKRVSGSFYLALGAGATLAFWPEWIYHSVRLMDYSLEGALLSLSILLVFFNSFEPLKKNSLKQNWANAIAGVFLGFLFFVRYQTAIHFISFFLIQLVFLLNPKLQAVASEGFEKGSSLSKSRKSRWTPFLFFLLFYGLTILILGGIEAKGQWVDFLRPLRNYLHFNFSQAGAEKFYGSAPWYRYFLEIFKLYGYLPFFVFICFLFIKPLKSFTRRTWLYSIFWILPLGIHTLIAHKEPRFILASLFLIIPLGWLSLSQKAFVQKHRSIRIALLLILGIGFALSAVRTSKRFLLHAETVKDFAMASEAIQKRSEGSYERPYDASPESLFVQVPANQSPGSFFLRWKGPLCYSGRAEANHSIRPGSPRSSPSNAANRDILEGAHNAGQNSKQNLTSCSKTDRIYLIRPTNQPRLLPQSNENSSLISESQTVWMSPSWIAEYIIFTHSI